MHKLQMYEGLRDMLEREVAEIEKKSNIDDLDLDHLYKLMTALKVTDRCIERECGESYANRRSYDGGSYRGGSNRGRSYDSYEGGSYERGRSNDGTSMDMMPWAYDGGMSNARRGRDGDGDGRYNESRDSFRGGSNRGRSNESGRSYEYSRDNSRKKMIQKLETLMDDTMSEYERSAIMDCIEKIK